MTDWTTEPHVWGRKGDPRTFMNSKEITQAKALWPYCSDCKTPICEHIFAKLIADRYSEGMEAAAKIAESQVDSYNKAGQWIAEAIRKAAKGK